jgi:hypothetical protein
MNVTTNNWRWLVSLTVATAVGACTDDPTTGGQGGTAGSSVGGSSSGTGGSGANAGSGGSGGRGGSAGQGGSGNAAGTGGSGGAAGSGGSTAGIGGGDAGVVITDAGVDGGITEPFTLIDFAGSATGAPQARSVAAWDLREVFTFDVSGSHTSSATVEVANSQAQVAFAQPAPDQPDAAGNSVFRLVKIPAASSDGNNWGGWAHVMFNLGSALPQDIVEALPQWGASTIVPGTKVIQLEAYYDDTVDPNFDWDDLLAIETQGGSPPDVFDSVTAQGYNVHLLLVNHAAHADVENGYDTSAGTYMGYSAYITAPNQWVTLTFSAADEGRLNSFYGVTSSQITGIDIKPAGGYEAQDSNPLYLRNLRIVDVP